jgi:hypothetical protein
MSRFADASHPQRQRSLAPSLKRRPRIEACFDKLPAKHQDRRGTYCRKAFGRANV